MTNDEFIAAETEADKRKSDIVEAAAARFQAAVAAARAEYDQSVVSAEAERGQSRKKHSDAHIAARLEEVKAEFERHNEAAGLNKDGTPKDNGKPVVPPKVSKAKVTV